MRIVVVGVGAMAAGALFLSACSSGSPSTSGTTTTTQAGHVTTTSSTTAAAAGTTSTTSGTGSGSGSGSPQNLAATAAVKSALTAAYLAHNGLPAAEVAGTAPNSVYYAYLPSTNTYWAVAGFVPTANASYNTQVAMQDEGCCGIFTMMAGSSWTYVASYLGAPCAGQIPASLEALWRLTPPGDCAPATTTTS